MIGVVMMNGDKELLLPLVLKLRPTALDIIVGGVLRGIKLLKNEESKVGRNIFKYKYKLL
jgi:hypothetical protein